ncbi:hypothetical protein FRC01_000989 [Tulasnella sp. 417]|nr:hypothetical protein FRC01_000989 [Tulasnella sp. 417]
MSKNEELKLYHCISIPDGDWKDIFDCQAIGMALMHNIIIRSFNSLLYYSGEVQPGTPEFASFLRYAQEVCALVRRRHNDEEKLYFPFLESRLGEGRMAGSVAAHEALSKPLAGFEDMVQKTIIKPHEWDLDLFRNLIYRFMPALKEHLKDELKRLDATELRQHFTEQDFKDYEKRFIKETVKSVVPSRGPQLVFVNGDLINGAWYALVARFPRFPPALVFLVKHVLFKLHSDMWAFGCCDREMKLKRPFARYEPLMKLPI